MLPIMFFPSLRKPPAHRFEPFRPANGCNEYEWYDWSNIVNAKRQKIIVVREQEQQSVWSRD
jgi:hypothetical protein